MRCFSRFIVAASVLAACVRCADAACVALTITNQPASVIAEELCPATFAIGVAGTLGTFQWFSNNIAIANATNSSFTIPRVGLSADGAHFHVVAGNTCSQATSEVAVLHVSLDASAPTLIYARGDATMHRIVLAFADGACAVGLDTNSAQDVSNYTVSGGVVISNAVVSQATNVVLNTSALTPGAIYDVSASYIADTRPTPSYGGGEARFQAWVARPGTSPTIYVPPPMRIERNASNAVIYWPSGGTLESAAAITGPWLTVSNASEPAVVPRTNAFRFFRAAFAE